MSRTIQPPTMHTKLVAASVSDMVQEWYQGKCEVPPMQADTFEQRISRFQSDLSQAAVAAALEAAAAHCKQVAEDCKKYNLPQAAGMVASVGREIRALITQPQHDALAAHVAAEVAKARAEDAELLYNAWLGLRVLENIAKVKGLSGAADVTTLLLAEIEAAHPEFAPRSALRAQIGATP